ncbi:MAG: alpha/beta fold hydrolase [Syntrophomonadaceae bacterium]|nr:alpha/beta fold hydrolase [Syntrophomonadaceae bacterium]MDD3022802.1 alpha/beta fold hydrolase [Syntrophomonadaceae bacterium]
MNTGPASAKPFLLRGSSDNVLLFIHGFTASPSEVYPTAHLLYEMSGYTISGPLLPGHGSTREEMNRSCWEDWFEAVKKDIYGLQENYQNVWVAGLSLGALLAIHGGIHCSGLRGVVAINPPVFIKNPHFKFLAPLLQNFRPYWPKSNMVQCTKLEEQGRFAYDCTPVQAFRSMMKLRDIVLREIHNITTPLLLMQSELDETVKIHSAKFLAGKVQIAKAIVLNLPNSQHIATMGPEKQFIAREIDAFIKQY